MKHTLRELLAVAVFAGYLAPKEHAHLLMVVRTAEGLHYLLGYVAAAAVGGYVCLAVPLRGIGVVCLGGGELYSAERARVDICLLYTSPSPRD